MSEEEIVNLLNRYRAKHSGLVWERILITPADNLYSHGIFQQAKYVKILDGMEVIIGKTSNSVGYRVVEAPYTTERLERTKVGQSLLDYFGFEHDRIPV